MKFVKMTLNYFTFKKFLGLMLVAAIPSFLLASVSTMSSISDFIINYDEKNLTNFITIFQSVSEFRFNNILMYILVIIVFVIGLTELFGTVERDMRVGNFTLRGFFRRLNNNAFSVSLITVFFMLSILFMGIIAAALFLLWAVIISNVLIAHILSMITAIILSALLFICWVNFILIVPTMIITGQSTIQSTRDSIRHTDGIFKSLFTAIIVPLFPMFFFVYLEKALSLNISFILDIIINDLLIVYYVVLMLVTHYEVSGLSREDLSPSNRYFN